MPRFRTGRRKDGSTYRYPITRRRGRKKVGRDVLHEPPMRILRPIRRVRVTEPLLSRILSSVLHQTPVFRELHLAHIVADSIYHNWSLVKELYEVYKKDGLVSIADSRAARRVLGSIQTNIIWKAIRGVIPQKLHDRSLDILSTVVDKITDEEIRYVKSFVQKNK